MKSVDVVDTAETLAANMNRALAFDTADAAATTAEAKCFAPIVMYSPHAVALAVTDEET